MFRMFRRFRIFRLFIDVSIGSRVPYPSALCWLEWGISRVPYPSALCWRRVGPLPLIWTLLSQVPHVWLGFGQTWEARLST